MERERVHRMVRNMSLARRFEELAAQGYMEGKFCGFLRPYPGEEAVAVGVLHGAAPSDYVISTCLGGVHVHQSW
jgi:pyruvate dehydrogenase E1 component alpha subunit